MTNKKSRIKNKLVQPFVKWVGGKRQILDSIKREMPQKFGTYYEPFLGGGAVFFALQRKSAVINDKNHELINVYQTIRDQPIELINALSQHENEEEHFYEIRGWDRICGFNERSNVERAARFIFLNKTCYNGLYRVNSSGEFNSPFGRYKNPNIINAPVIKAVSNYLNDGSIRILNGDYHLALADVKKSDFVYLDPPYHPISAGSNFTGYTEGGFNMFDQIDLRKFCDELNKKGVYFILSNSSSDFICDQYSNYKIITLKATRAINSKAAQRGAIDEFLIKNF